MKSHESISLSLAILFAAKGIYKDRLLAAINIGDDADTNGTIVGALSGTFDFSGNIDKSWIDKVRQTNDLDLLALAMWLNH